MEISNISPPHPQKNPPKNKKQPAPRLCGQPASFTREFTETEAFFFPHKDN